MYRICLSVDKMDKDFVKMKEVLSLNKQIEVVDNYGLSDYSLKDYDIFIGKKLSPEILSTANRLKYCFAYKTGVDDFPLQELDRLGITLVNSHADSEYIAQYAFGLALSLTNRITEFDKKFRSGYWYDKDDPYWESLFEMKVGLVGFGRIGQSINDILIKNEIETYTINRGKEYKNIKTVANLEELCKVCNLIILSLPKTRETNKIIDEKILTLLKDKYLINIGRSNCIDDTALALALEKNEIGGAALDTWDVKPVNKENVFIHSSFVKFLSLNNVILSPHQAMNVEKGHSRYVEDITDKIINFVESGTLKDVVDLKKGY